MRYGHDRIAAREDGIRRLSSLTTGLAVTATAAAGALTVAAAIGSGQDTAAAQQRALAQSTGTLPPAASSGGAPAYPGQTVPQQTVPQQTLPQQPVWTPPQYTAQPPVGQSSGS